MTIRRLQFYLKLPGIWYFHELNNDSIFNKMGGKQKDRSQKAGSQIRGACFPG